MIQQKFKTHWAIVGTSLAACGMMGVWAETTWAGTLRTRDGKVLLGKVEFKAANQVQLFPADGAPVTIPLQDIAHLAMAAAPGTPVQPRDRDPHLPLPWQQSDIGRVKEPGSGREDHGVFALRGAGWGTWGVADSFHYVYQAITGDVDVKARLGDRPTEESPFVVGLAMREGLDPTAAQASVMMFPGGGLRMGCRPVHGATEAAPPAGTKPYEWVRLVRAGDRFSGFCSSDGTNWTLVGTVKVKMDATANVGMGCASTLNHRALGTSFDHVTVIARAQGPVEGLGLVDGSLLAGWVKRFDEKGFTYADATGAEHTLPPTAVAFIFTRPLPEDVRQALVQGKPGVVLASGDQIEGDVQGMRDGRVAVNSLLLGQQTLPMAKAVMVVLRPVTPAGPCSLSVRDGSIFRCLRVTVAEVVLTAEGGIAGTISLKTEDLVALDFGQER